MMADLYALGAIDEPTMRDFNKAGLTTLQGLSAEEIRSVREKEYFGTVMRQSLTGFTVRFL